mmetsp:Transcript_16306/g.38697  ORF Transcript_16306/g.38697 Transcript_16306/m.38697 type:complete len:236 (+) Transcript_16306:354-1061(+)
MDIPNLKSSALGVAEKPYVPIVAGCGHLRMKRIVCHIADDVAVTASQSMLHGRRAEIVLIHRLILRADGQVSQARRESWPARLLPCGVPGETPNAPPHSKVPQPDVAILSCCRKQLICLAGMADVVWGHIQHNRVYRAAVPIADRPRNLPSRQVKHLDRSVGSGGQGEVARELVCTSHIEHSLAIRLKAPPVLVRVVVLQPIDVVLWVVTDFVAVDMQLVLRGKHNKAVLAEELG